MSDSPATCSPLILTAMQMEAKALADFPDVRAVGIRACGLQSILHNPSCVIMAGLAGALDPTLAVGDIVIDDPHHLCPPHFRRGIHTVDSLIPSVPAKAALFAQTQMAAVEMENAIVRRLAAQRAIPFIGVRAISDTAQQELDPAIMTLVDPVGRPRPSAVALFLMRRPSKAAQLMRLKRDSDIALAALAPAVREILAAIR